MHHKVYFSDSAGFSVYLSIYLTWSYRPTRDCKRNSIAEFAPHKAEWLLLGQLQGGNSFQSPFGRGSGQAQLLENLEILDSSFKWCMYLSDCL